MFAIPLYTADLHFCSRELDTGLHCRTINKGYCLLLYYDVLVCLPAVVLCHILLSLVVLFYSVIEFSSIVLPLLVGN